MNFEKKSKVQKHTTEINLVDNLDHKATKISEGVLRGWLRKYNNSQKYWLVFVGALSIFLTTMPSIRTAQDPFWQAFYVLLAVFSFVAFLTSLIKLLWDWGSNEYVNEEKIISNLFNKEN